MDRSALNEHILALLARGQHRDAVHAAIESEGIEIRSFLIQRVGALDASEVFSMFCEDLTRGIGGFRGECPFDLWLQTLARNAAARWLSRWHDRGVRGFETTEEQKLADRPARDATEPWKRTSVKHEFEQLRRQLTEDEIALLTLRVAQELSWDEIARRWPDPDLPAPELDVDERLRKIAGMLRKRFERLKEKLRKLADEVGLLDRAETGSSESGGSPGSGGRVG